MTKHDKPGTTGDEVFRPMYRFGTHLTQEFDKLPAPGPVAVIMGSTSDWQYAHPCTNMLERLEIEFEYGVVSAHRTPDRMERYLRCAAERGFKAIITCAGGSAHLPGMAASHTLLPVFGFSPKKTDVHAVGSMIDMPAGVPLAYMGGGSEPGRNAGATNAALLVARIFAVYDPNLRARLAKYVKEDLHDKVPFACF